MTHAKYLAGITTTQCRLPRQVTKTVTKFSTDQEIAGSAIAVGFSNGMQATRTSLVQFDPIKSLCDIGGMLGLWLRLGALQLGELLVRTVQRVAGKLALYYPALARAVHAKENN